MAQRVIIGRHPFGSYGLFVSRPGYDANYQDPNSRDAWLFSSNWSKVGSILASGTCSRGQRVYHYDPGYLPQVFFETYVNGVTLPASVDITSTGTANSNNSTIEIYTRFACNHYTNGSFQIDRQLPVANDADTSIFRYIVFALPF